ncbi:Bestrophin domain-containing protein [Rhizoctonia solani AG-1 IA]|uniref:Bestrophin domain-containing protein n=1 Tax=Thanatephorus cucumeris (strain AG1-IA) TaxID=983506 RepID=L8X2S8_THACA|nr:Bestrophin domain-containing protein [Rhizoctonia solani AG-1 IA]
MIPIVTLVAYTLMGIEGISQIEMPFGRDPSDLPLDRYCAELRDEIEYIMENLAEGDDDLESDDDRTALFSRGSCPGTVVKFARLFHQHDRRLTEKRSIPEKNKPRRTSASRIHDASLPRSVSRDQRRLTKSQSEGSKRSGVEATPPTTTMNRKLEPLPPESDFRTSLIMPSLSRRFTLLRGQNGEPLSIDDVRTRLANQRANGHVNQVTEEEEEIMIDALIRAHSIDPSAASASDSDGYTTATANDGYSTANTNTNDSYSGYDSPQSYRGYVRPAARSMVSANPPPKRKVTLSTPSVPARDGPMFDAKQGNGDVVNGTQFDTYLSNSSFSPAQIRRASLALQDAIQEYEEEEEDEKILAPRRGDQHQREHESHAGDSPVGYGEAIAWSNDQPKHMHHDSPGSTAVAPYHPTGTSSPVYRMDTVNRLPGYVPGMHRPITPRDSGVDTDTNTGTSTPQPVSNASTTYEYGSNVSSPSRTERTLPQSILNKRASTTSPPLRTRPRELSNSDQYDGGGSSSDTTQVPLKSALSDKRRPTSPLVDSAYQSAIRAGTPSNYLMDTWSPTTLSFAAHSPSQGANSGSLRGSHMREISNSNSGLDSSDTYYSNQPQSRSLASPSLPDSPTINGSGLANIASSLNGATTNVIVDEPVHRTSTPRLSTLENGHASRGMRPYSPHTRTGTPNANTRRTGGHSRNGSLADTTISAGRRSPRASQAHSSSSATRPNPLMMSPMLNSSRSSLASTGSSYHSWDEDQLGGKKPHKRGVSVFIDSDSAPWKKSRSGIDADLEMESAPAPEHMRDVLAGLSMQDLIAVQNKLVSVAVKKRVSVPGVRPLSGPRRRRASAGQSVASLATPTEPEVSSEWMMTGIPLLGAQTPPPNPILTPPPPATPPMTKSAEDQAKKANALLHAMMDSIESSPHKMTTPPTTAPSSVPSPSPQPQALAPQTSFSSEEPQSVTPPTPEEEPITPDTPVPDQDQRQKALADALFGSDSDATVKDPNPGFGRSQSLRAFAMPPVSSSPPPDADVSPAQSKSTQDDSSLAEEIERRAMAATAALKSASTPRLNDGTNGRKAGKKVNPRQISSPQLVSATTSVDTMGLAAAAAAAGSNPSTPQQTAQTSLPHTQSKLSQRIKKFTGNLRPRAPIPTGEEISPYVVDVSTPPSTEPTQLNLGNRLPSGPTATASRVPSNPEPKSAPPTIESPINTPSTPDGSAQSSGGTPTSTQPRLRGFMARLRKGRKDSTVGTGEKPRAPSPLGPNNLKPIPAPPHIPAAMLKLQPVPMPENMSTSSLGGSATGIEAPPPPPPPLSAPQSAPADMSTGSIHTPALSQQVDEEALRRLYDAASQLGLDHSAINDILVRSQSTSSRSTGWTQASPMTPTSHTIDAAPAPSLPSVLERSMSVTTPKPPRPNPALGRQLSLKPYNGLPLRPTPSQEESTPRASVVRRTVIFPTPPGRASSEMSRRPSSRHRRNRSGSVHSNKSSVQDRTPTPPPSRAPINKRFSKDASPPVPQLPNGIEGSVTSTLQVPSYDMYAEDSEEQQPVGSAVEVLELSDGQIVWSVVDGLRSTDDDEGDDTFAQLNRTSEYSVNETQQLRFREHQRSASKTSTTSKASNELTPKRPETRVFVSNAGDIGTLLDSLTKSYEAGQFNIVPGVPGALGHLRPISGSASGPNQSGSLSVQSGSISANSFGSSFNSDGDYTLEERLDQMITSSRRRAGL